MRRLRLAVLPLVIAASLTAVSAAEASPSGVVISKFRTRTAASQYDEYAQITNTTSAATRAHRSRSQTTTRPWSASAFPLSAPRGPGPTPPGISPVRSVRGTRVAGASETESHPPARGR